MFVYSELYRADIGAHVFPTQKYIMILDKLNSEGILDKNNIIAPSRPKDKDLLKIITPEYLDDLLNARLTERTFPSEMPVNRQIIDAQILCCDGSYQAAKIAMERGGGYHIGGGFHHAFSDHAEGFCYLNDICYAAVLIGEKDVSRIAVVDCDLHQGNGTARFFGDNDNVFTFSIHQEHLYPRKERSDLDIGLDIGTKDSEYLDKLGKALDHIYDKFKPDLVIYQAGADPYIFDQLGNLSLTIEGLRKRDEMVIKQAVEKKIRVAVVLGGGYAEDVNDTVEIHCNTARVLFKVVQTEH